MEKSFIVNASRQIADEFLTFVNKAVSPYHAVHQGCIQLQSAGFKELHENENWDLAKGGKYYFTRNYTTLIAFTIGPKFDANKTGFQLIGAHTDSPVLRLAPISKLNGQKFRQTCVTTYGGGLWHTWFDRELTLAGRVIYRDGESQELKHTLFHYDKPLLKIPNLAIHLRSGDEREKFSFNTETHLRPVFSSEVYEKLSEVDYEKDKEKGTPLQNNHYAGLLGLVSRETKIETKNIVDLDFSFVDTQPSRYFGLHEEFISSPRLDNLFSTFHAIRAIASEQSFDTNSSFINLAVCFDHEQCGSESFQGASSAFLLQTLERIFQLLSESQGKDQGEVQKDSLQTAFLNSFIISADMAHGIHPNYSDKHQVNHQVGLNQGIVLKINPNQRYSTDGVGAGLLQYIAELHKVPLQEFIVKNDSPCGSTIGPIVASGTGIKTVDVGAPQWGMHSIRETCGVVDSLYYDRLFTGFYRDFEKIPQSLSKF